jgi:hypothetical protein
MCVSVMVITKVPSIASQTIAYSHTIKAHKSIIFPFHSLAKHISLNEESHTRKWLDKRNETINRLKPQSVGMNYAAWFIGILFNPRRNNGLAWIDDDDDERRSGGDK